MSLRENLAVNLRRLCAARGSIAAVCREMGINRQQFDRYLSMDALPNRATTARICAYFGIEEAELYRDPESADETPRPARLSRLRGQNAVEGQIIERLFASPQPTIAPGYYQTYFSIPGDPAQVLCAVTSIRAEGGRTTFRRVTGIAESKGTIWSHFRGDHEGVVLERFNWFFFIGLNRRDPQEPTFLAMQWGPFSPETLLCGHAMIFAQSGLAITTVVMRAVPKGMSLLSALRSAKVYSASDPAIGPLVKLALEGKYAPMPGSR
jgi:hypothetical protein